MAYARDAFDGLSLMDKVAQGEFDTYLAAIQSRRAGKATRTNRTQDIEAAENRGFGPVDVPAARARREADGGRTRADPAVLGPACA